MSKQILDRADKIELRKQFKAINKEGKYKKSAIYSELANRYGISTHYCGNIIRAKRV